MHKVKLMRVDARIGEFMESNAQPLFLNLTYEVEDDANICEVFVEGVPVCINRTILPTIGEFCDRPFCIPEKTIDVGFGEFRYGGEYAKRIIKTKTKEMTLEEIEKALGHKVKIVNNAK